MPRFGTWRRTSGVLAAAASAMAEQPKHVFYDMVHSNNAARIRLWLALKEGAAEHVETCATPRTAGPGRPRPAARVWLSLCSPTTI